MVGRYRHCLTAATAAEVKAGGPSISRTSFMLPSAAMVTPKITVPCIPACLASAGYLGATCSTSCLFASSGSSLIFTGTTTITGPEFDEAEEVGPRSVGLFPGEESLPKNVPGRLWHALST